jgi:hypothetical protein
MPRDGEEILDVNPSGGARFKAAQLQEAFGIRLMARFAGDERRADASAKGVHVNGVT